MATPNEDEWVDVPPDEWVDVAPAPSPASSPPPSPKPPEPAPRTAFDVLTAPFNPRKLEPLVAGMAGSLTFEGLPIIGGGLQAAKEAGQELLGLDRAPPKPGEEGLSAYERGRRQTLGYLQGQEETDPERFRAGQYLGIVGPMAASLGLGGAARAAATKAPAAASKARQALDVLRGLTKTGAEGAVSAAAPAALGEVSRGKPIEDVGRAALDAAKLGGGVGAGVPLVGMAAGAGARRLGRFAREAAPGLAVKASGGIQKDINKVFAGEEERVAEAGQWALGKPELLPGLAPSKSNIRDAASSIRQKAGAEVGSALRASTVAPTYDKVQADAQQLWESLTNTQREYMGPEFVRLRKITDDMYGVRRVPTPEAEAAVETLQSLMGEQKALAEEMALAKMAQRQLKSHKAAGVPVTPELREQAAYLPVLEKRQKDTAATIKQLENQKAPSGGKLLDEKTAQPTKQPTLQEFNAEKSDIDSKTNFGATNQDEASANAARMAFGNQVLRRNVYEAAEQGLSPEAFERFKAAMNDYGHATTFEQLGKAGFARELGNDPLGLVAKMVGFSSPVAAAAAGDISPLLGGLATAGALKFYNERGAGTAAKLLSKTGRLLTPEKEEAIKRSARLLGSMAGRAGTRATLLPRYGEEPLPSY